MSTHIIRNGKIVNEGKILEADILIKNERIEKIAPLIDVQENHSETVAGGNFVIPGIIDDQVHFREPGLTHKAEIYTEAKAGVSGGVTTYMEMPNTKPPALTQKLLQDKYEIASERSLANYSFFMGTSNENIEEVLKTDPEKVCGVKIFMGSSTGNMLVDDEKTLENIFSKIPLLIATHCEDEETIEKNTREFREKYGEDVPMKKHPEIRSVEACYKSSSMAVAMAKKYDARLHILHISTADEIGLFEKGPVENKRITSEACVHHLFFDSDDYQYLGSKIKCNPAIKEPTHKETILRAVIEDQIDIIATDHAPHTLKEKNNKYFNAPSGVPLIQHSLNIMMTLHQEGKISMERIVDKMCHCPAKCFQVKERGYIREGYFADLVVVDPDINWRVEKSNILYKCGWSPFEGHNFQGRVQHTFINGNHVFAKGHFNESKMGQRLSFDR